MSNFFEGWLADWRESRGSFSKPSATEDAQQCFSGMGDKPLSNGRNVPYLMELGNGTAKARFYCTSIKNDIKKGFWIPKSAILCDDEKAKILTVAKWVNLTIITYNW